VHSNGHTALQEAAVYGNRRIVRLLVASGADVNAEDDDGCAVSACGRSA
jgi:ankyrin repeat protein